MASSMTNARENRQSVRIFDVDLFRNKLENFMRKQAEEMCEMVNNKKRKYSDRWSEIEKEDLDLSEDYRDHTVFQFGKRQRGDSYYPIDDDELEMEEVSPLALPSPVSIYAGEPTTSYFENQPPTAIDEEADSMSMAMRRQVTGYSEVTTAYADDDAADDSWMSPCPPLSRASLSSSSSMPDTPNNGGSSSASDFGSYDHEDDTNQFMMSHLDLDLDLASMEPHERTLLAALAPDRFEKAALIKRAFRQSDKLLDHLVRDAARRGEDKHQDQQDTVMAMHMDDGEYDQVFGELMHI